MSDPIIGRMVTLGDNVNTDVLHPSRFFSLDDRTVRSGFLQAAAGYEQAAGGCSGRGPRRYDMDVRSLSL